MDVRVNSSGFDVARNTSSEKGKGAIPAYSIHTYSQDVISSNEVPFLGCAANMTESGQLGLQRFLVDGVLATATPRTNREHRTIYGT